MLLFFLAIQVRGKSTIREADCTADNRRFLKGKMLRMSLESKSNFPNVLAYVKDNKLYG